MSENLEEKVFSLISRTLGKEQSNINLDTKIEDLSKDSIELFQLILAFQKEFNAEADYEKLIQIETIRDIIGLLEDKNAQISAK